MNLASTPKDRRVFKMYLVTSDLHFTDKPRDEHRFGLFDWLCAEAKKEGTVDGFIILGDVTDAKDGHKSVLVNRIVNGFLKLSKIAPVYILMGNHDAIDYQLPFFQFSTSFDEIYFFSSPYELTLDFYHYDKDEMCKREVLFLPATKNVEEEWDPETFDEFDFIFTHQTFDGSICENGTRLPGISPKIFSGTDARVYSGDIHVPQKIGKITYVGSPYHIHFGDSFKPRVLLISADSEKSLHFKTVSKPVLNIKSPEDLYKKGGLKEGDQVQIRITLPRSEFALWNDYRQRIQEITDDLGLQNFGIRLIEKVKRKRLVVDEIEDSKRSMLDWFESFCKEEGVGKEEYETGLSLLQDWSKE